MSGTYYLREDVYIDPLVNKWYAWPNLLAPATYAMYMSKTHRRLMKSFVSNAELHIMASQDPTMVGSPDFVHCTQEQVEEVKALLDKFETDGAKYIAFAEAIKELNILIKQHVDGTTIEHLYEQVPDILKGYVELHMDLHHNVSYRFIEGMLYKSDYYDANLQGISFGLLNEIESRPFVLSTPRLPTDNTLHVSCAFKDSCWDKLFSARTQPISKQEIDEIFAGKKMEGGLDYMALFTSEPPIQTHIPVTEGVRLQYVGHAGIMVETPHSTLLVDPIIASRGEAYASDILSHSDLPAHIDYLCLTHNHSDHVNIESLIQIRHKVGTVVVPKNNGGALQDPSLKLILSNVGFNVIEVEDMEEIALPEGRIVSIPFLGEHGDLNIRSKCAWLFELNGKRIYSGADSSNLEPRMYELLQKEFGDLDILAIGMECVGAPYTWLYGALTTENISRKIKESRRLNGSDYEAAKGMVDIFNPSKVLIYALGMEPWFGYFMGVDYSDDSEQIVQSGQLLEYCKQKNIPVERLYGLYKQEL